MTDQTVIEVAHKILAFVVPHLMAGAGAALEQTTEQIPEAFASLFRRLRARLTSPAASGALEDVIAEPANQLNQEALLLQLRKLLQSDPIFASEMVTALQNAGVTIGTGTATITGNSNIAIQNSPGALLQK